MHHELPAPRLLAAHAGLVIIATLLIAAVSTVVLLGGRHAAPMLNATIDEQLYVAPDAEDAASE